MRALNTVVATDDFLCERLHYCLLCGARAAILDQVMIQLDDLWLATVWCLPCRNRAAGSLQPLIDVLARRYAPERGYLPKAPKRDISRDAYL